MLLLDGLADLATATGVLLRFLAGRLAATFLAPGGSLSVGALGVSLLIAAFLAIPSKRKRWPRPRAWARALFPRRLWRSVSGRADLGWLSFNMFVFGVAFGWAVMSSDWVAQRVVDGLTVRFGAPRASLGQPAAAATLTVASFVAYEFAYWLDHYLSHRIPLLWRFHRVHHAAESLSLLTNFRVHPVDTIVFYNLVAIFMGGVAGLGSWGFGSGARPWTIGGSNALIMLAAIGLTHFHHSHFWLTFGPRWGRWLLSPAQHQVHHSVDPKHFDRNFGNALAIFDRLFGTLRMPAATREATRFGLPDDGMPHHVPGALMEPFLPSGRRSPPAIDPGAFRAGAEECGPA